MAYLQHTSWKDRPGAVAAVIAIHAVIGYALVSGLSFRQFVETPPRIQSTFVPDIPLPPPPDPVDEPKAEATPQKPVVAPLPPLVLSPRPPLVDTLPTPLPVPDTPRIALPVPTPDVGPRKPAFDPVAAKPRNDPSGWVTTADYRPSWINREMTGTARFRLDIAASGRVENCTITASSGHAELDRATCDLVSRRARFEAARNGEGDRTAGSFASAVRWELPR